MNTIYRTGNHCHHVGAFYKYGYAIALIHGEEALADHLDKESAIYFEMAEDSDKPEYIDEHGMALKCCDVPGLPCSGKLDDDFVTHSPVGD